MCNGRKLHNLFSMRLPEWLVKAGARLEGDRLFFDDLEVEYKCEDLENGEIPTLYQVRHFNPEDKERGEIGWSGFSCGLDLSMDKELVWICGAYFETFREAFKYWETNIRADYEGTHMYLCEDHMNLIRYSSQDCWCEDQCDCGPDRIVHRPDTIKLLPEERV